MTTSKDAHPPYANLTLTAHELWILAAALPRFWSQCEPDTRFVAKGLWSRIEELRTLLDEDARNVFGGTDVRCCECGRMYYEPEPCAPLGDVCPDCYRGR